MVSICFVMSCSCCWSPMPLLNNTTIPFAVNVLACCSIVEYCVLLNGSWNGQAGIYARLTSNLVSQFCDSSPWQWSSKAPSFAGYSLRTSFNSVKPSFLNHLSLQSHTNFFSTDISLSFHLIVLFNADHFVQHTLQTYRCANGLQLSKKGKFHITTEMKYLCLSFPA